MMTICDGVAKGRLEPHAEGVAQIDLMDETLHLSRGFSVNSNCFWHTERHHSIQRNAFDSAFRALVIETTC